MSYIKRIATVAIVSVALIIIIAWTSTMFKTVDNGKSNLDNLQDKSMNNTSSSSLGTAVVSAVTPYVTEYSLPNGTWPNAILVDKKGMVWTVGSKSDTLIELDPKDLQLRSYQIPEDAGGIERMAWSMVEDKDNFTWFSQFGPEHLWRFDPETGKFEPFHTDAPPFQMKVDNSTGDIWFTTLSSDTLGVVQKIKSNTESDESYKISEFPTGNDTYPSGLTLNGNSVWITEIEKGKVAKFDVMRDANGLVVDVKKTLEIPTKIQLSIPTDLLFSSNRTLWITEHGPSTITKLGLNSQGFTRFATSQNRYDVASLPFWLRESSDRQGFWFNEHEGGNVAFFNVSSTTLTEFDVPTNSTEEVAFMLNLATDPHDPYKAWFSEWNSNRIGVVNRNLAIPFDINSNLDKVVLGNGSLRQEIDITISGNGKPIGSNYTTINLKASSSMEPAAGFVNMSAKFMDGNILDLTGASKQHFKLLLEDHSAPPGNYTVGISATNGMMTKTIFLDLIVRP
ncbi:MAG: hypothetical protein ACREA3_01600 [Nitrosotalea sp.]